jgi:glycoside/pentoside/hexuronide:cation symporter, GPH family
LTAGPLLPSVPAVATEQAIPEKLPPRTVAAYAAGVGPVAILGLPFTIYLPPYIAEGGVIAVGLVGLLFSICTLWDGFIDPALGTMIDRVKAGEAPHRRWMRIALLPLAALMVAIVTVGDTLPFLVLLPLFFFFYSALSLYDVAHLSWGSALAAEPAESARVFGNREWASKLILIPAFAAPALAQAAIPGLDLQGRILAYASLFALAFPLALWAIARTPPRPVAPEPGIGWRREITATLRFRPLVLLIAVQALNAFAFGSLTSLFVFFADGALRLDGQSAFLLFGTFVGGAITTPFWTRIAIWLGKPRGMIAMAVFLTAMLTTGFIMPSAQFWPALIFSTLLGSGFVGLIFIHGMVSDLTPADRTRCGRDRTAFLFALINFIQRASVAASIAIAYALLGAMGFDAKNAAASGDAIRLLFLGLPALAWTTMAGVLWALSRDSAMARGPAAATT